MTTDILLPTALFLLAGFLLSLTLSLRRNIRAAQATGLPYVVVPYFAYNALTSMFFRRTVLAWATAIWGSPGVTSWRRLAAPTWPWALRHAPFAQLGADTFLTVAPGGIIVHTADASVVSQVVARGNDFPKPVHLYSMVDVYGKNIVSSNGEAWKHHRRVIAPIFDERLNQLVWREALMQARAMVESWAVGETITTLGDDAMRLSLNVLGRAGVGEEMKWPKEPGSAFRGSGPTIGFAGALQYLLNNLLVVLSFPKWVLKYSPDKGHRRIMKAYNDWGDYMKKALASKGANGRQPPSMDIIGHLMRAKSYDDEKAGKTPFTDSEVMGNLFVLFIAGHETSAGSIHFSLLFLAMNPQIQKQVQAELDAIFGGLPVSEWDYERDLPQLLTSMLGAVLNEQLRLIAPIINVPKLTSSKPQQLLVDGRSVTIPAGAIVRLCVPAIHRNPRFWPHGSPADPQKPYFPLDNLDNDLEEFKPQRWMRYNNELGQTTFGELEPQGAEPQETTPLKKAAQVTLPPILPSSHPLFTPLKGSYIPFSDGPRACLGRRFAQVEILAALAAILSTHTIELAVDAWAADTAVERMTGPERAAIWRKAEQQAQWTWQNKMACVITLQIRGAHVPVRLVRRGEERFV